MAASVYCSPLPEFLTSERCIDEKAGVISYGFIKDTTYSTFVDLTDNAEWIVAIAAGNVLVAYDARGEFPASSANESDDTYGYGIDSEILSKSFTLTVEHKGIHIGASGARDNITAYTSLMQNAGVYRVWWVDSDFKLWISTKPVSVNPSQVLPRSKREQQFWQVETKWVDLELPQTWDAPAITYVAP